MRAKRFGWTVMILALGTAMGGCAAAPEQAPPDGHTSQIALDWAGGYTGQLPAQGKQPARSVSLWLSPKQAYRLDVGDWGSHQMQSFTGKVAWQAGRAVELVGAPPGLSHWQVREGGLRSGGDEAVDLTQVPPLLGALALPSQWQLTELPGTVLDPADKAPFLQFSMTERVAGFDGCNRLMGGFTQTGANGLAFKPLAGTMMACVKPNLPDRAFTQMLPKVASAHIQGEQLVFTDAQGAVLAQFRAVSSQALPSASRKNSASRPD